MTTWNLVNPMNRRRALMLGGNLAGSLAATAALGRSQTGRAAGASPSDDGDDDHGIFNTIENIIGAQGMSSNGVFSIEIDRNDVSNVTLRGVPIYPAFQINGNLYFQKLGDEKVIMNSDMALKPDELDPFIDQLLANNIVFQAEHQHFYDFLLWSGSSTSVRQARPRRSLAESKRL